MGNVESQLVPWDVDNHAWNLGTPPLIPSVIIGPCLVVHMTYRRGGPANLLKVKSMFSNVWGMSPQCIANGIAVNA